jgi:beta-lactamase superfamily II metal-dependent hydrolase
MIFSLDVRRARKGDCLLLHFGSRDKPGLVMIDGGPKNVYKPYLRPRIDQIRTARKLDKQDSLIVDLLMVSHVDDDHIQGILDLTKEEIVAAKARRPRLINVQSFWHNSFDEIIDHKPDELTASVKRQFGTAAVSGGGELADKEKEEVEERYAEENPGEDSDEQRAVVSSTLKVLASIEQGFRLRQDAEGLGFPRNLEFDGKLIIARDRGKPVPVAQGLKFTVLGPMQPEIEALHQKHHQWLADLQAKGKSPSEALAAYVDKSVPNLSSIVVLAEVGGKRMLLTGDARGDKVLEGLELAGLLGPGDDNKIEVDILKVPHHGSSNNLDQDFFKRLVAKHYVFSGNGEHGNPERESLEMLLDARGDEAYQIHLTYPVTEIDVERKKEWDKERNKQVVRKKKTPKTKVREKWSSRQHSLSAFLQANPGFSEKVRIVDANKAHVIDLGDPLQEAWPSLVDPSAR